MSEIAENDYNLNIPRYVDTFEEEPPVDLAAALDELKAIDAALKETDERIASFCRELGLEAPR
jgi:type I restriction enzyme M protein